MWPSTNICVHGCVQRSQKNIQYCVFLKFSQSYYLGKGLSVSLGLTVSARLALLLPPLGLQSFYKDAGIQTQVFTIQPSPQPQKKCFFFFFLYFPSITLFKLFVLPCHPGIIPCHTPSGQWGICHCYHLFIHSQTADGTSYMLATELCLALMVHKTVVVSVLKSRTKTALWASTGDNQKVPQSLFIIRPRKENIWKIHILHLISSDFCSSLGSHTSGLQGWWMFIKCRKI